MPKKTKSEDKTMDYRLLQLKKIPAGLKKLKHHGLQKTIRLLKNAQGKKDDGLKKKVEKLEKKLVMLKKVSPDDMRLMTLFLLELEFGIKLDTVADGIEAVCPGWRKMLTELTVIVPIKAADEEIDMTEGSNSRYVGILNFYELIKMKQPEAFKELTDMIDILKQRTIKKIATRTKRRETKKLKKSDKKADGAFKSPVEYEEEKKVAKVERDAKEVIRKEEKEVKLKEEALQKKIDKLAKEAAKQEDGDVADGKPKWSKKAGNMKSKKGIKKEPKAGDQETEKKGDSNNKKFEKRDFNDKAKTFNKDQNKKFGNKENSSTPRPVLTQKFQKPEFTKPMGGKPMGGPKRPDGTLHPSWSAMVEKRERESKVDLHKKAAIMEIE